MYSKFLTEGQIQLWRKNLQFYSKDADPVEYRPAIDPSNLQLGINVTSKSTIRHQITSRVTNHRRVPRFKKRQKFNRNKSIMILATDKGRATVIKVTEYSGERNSDHLASEQNWP